MRQAPRHERGAGQRDRGGGQCATDQQRPRQLASAAGGEGSVATLSVNRGPGHDGEPAGFDPLGDPNDDNAARNRPLLIGGALTSAALSIAGAAIVACRRTRPARSPMARAVRAAHAERLRRAD